MKWILRCFVTLIIPASSIAQLNLHSTHHVPIEKNLSPAWTNALYSNQKTIYKGNQLLTIGMPCGGIAAGQLYVRGDGTLANWWISNNAYNTGYGVDSLTRFNTALGPWKVCYQTFEPFSYIDQGFVISVGKQNKRLDKNDFDNISFVGEYPLAKIEYASKSNPLPVNISAEIFSPFIPMNARESATPATILRYTIRNTSSKPQPVSLTGWLQNLVCLDIASDINADARNRVVRSSDKTSVFMDLSERPAVQPPVTKISGFEDFESGYKKWKVTGNAFGSAPARGSFGGDQSKLIGYTGNGVVNSFLNGDVSMGTLTSNPFYITENFIHFKLGGGNHPGKTCMNLVVNGIVVRTATGRNVETLEAKSWDVTEFKGRSAYIEIVDQDQGGWGHVNVDDIAFADQPVFKAKYFPAMHPYNGNVSLTVLGGNSTADANYTGMGDASQELAARKLAGNKLVGAVGTSVTLKPGESKTITFLLSWFFPNRPSYYYGSDVTEIIGNDWNQALPTDGATIIGNMYANWYGSSLEVADWLTANLKRLSAETLKFHDAYYNNSSLPYWLTQRLLMPASTLATETCQWWANDKFWAWEGVGSCVGTCTHVWNYEQLLAHLFPELERNIREKTDFGESFQKDGSVLARNGWGGILIDGHAGSILKAYREYLNSKDNLFLARNWDRIRKATEFLVSEDENEDGLIEKTQANTYDIAFYGANTYVGSLYLAALKAAGRMASLMGDSSFESKCLSIASKGEKNSVSRLWNGQFFIQDVDLKKHPEFQYGDGCLSDQLFGQTWSHLNDLGYIYPKENVRSALQAIWDYNWAPDVETQNKVHPPERTYASPGEAGLLVASWPYSQHMGEDGVRYRDEVWTGIEYQVATNLIYEDMTEEGLSIVKAIHDRYSPEKHNPWNEIECGDHYARAMASWGVLMALQNYNYNGPAMSLGFHPKIMKQDFRSFFTGSEGWGNIMQSINGNKQTNELILRYGKLKLKEFGVTPLSRPASFDVMVNGKRVKADMKPSGEKYRFVFDMIELKETDRLSVTMTF
jgi:uncharacterized protein (DUF608 family)